MPLRAAVALGAVVAVEAVVALVPVVPKGLVTDRSLMSVVPAVPCVTGA